MGNGKWEMDALDQKRLGSPFREGKSTTGICAKRILKLMPHAPCLMPFSFYLPKITHA